jgi:hypothetical protein
VVDLDGDNDLEIIFGDENRRIQAFHHDGSVVSGWPAVLPTLLAEGPVAIGDLQNNGNLAVIAGSDDGRAFAYDANGDLLPGWPFDTGEGANTYVAIGALGGSSPRVAAVCSGERLHFLNYAGNYATGYFWFWPGRTFTAPVAIGDVDGDGVPEAVGGIGDWVFAVHATEASSVFGRGVSSDVSDAVTLGDLDLDGDQEVLVPTSNGTLYALSDDGSDHPGSWPFVSSTGSSLSSAAIAQVRGFFEPEVAVAATNWHVHLLWQTGIEVSGYPVETADWFIYGAPILGYVEDDASADVIVGARGYRGWAWDNYGGLIPGWPKWFNHHVYLPPAMGDIDLDGRAEIVFLSWLELIVLDVNQAPPVPYDSWPMYGYDPQRSGCWDCEELVTGVDPDPEAEVDGFTRVSFAAPTPNPIAGAAEFSFVVPGRALVRLEIYDIRGRRVATIYQEEVTPGPHIVAWNGRDDQGRSLASGQYLARLQVRGPDLDENLVRKITVLR